MLRCPLGRGREPLTCSTDKCGTTPPCKLRTRERAQLETAGVAGRACTHKANTNDATAMSERDRALAVEHLLGAYHTLQRCSPEQRCEGPQLLLSQAGTCLGEVGGLLGLLVGFVGGESKELAGGDHRFGLLHEPPAELALAGPSLGGAAKLPLC